MDINAFEAKDEETYMALCREFYNSNSTIKPFNPSYAQATFRRVLEHHENLWGYMLSDKQTGHIIGYALVTSYWCNEEGGQILILDELYISPDSRHNGYGSLFLHWLEQEFHGKARAITLEVLKTNQTAQSLYRKDGMSPDGFVTYTKDID